MDAYARLAYLEFESGNYNKAIEYCDKAIKTFDDLKGKVVRIDIILALKAYIFYKIQDDK